MLGIIVIYRVQLHHSTETGIIRTIRWLSISEWLDWQLCHAVIIILPNTRNYTCSIILAQNINLFRITYYNGNYNVQEHPHGADQSVQFFSGGKIIAFNHSFIVLVGISTRWCSSSRPGYRRHLFVQISDLQPFSLASVRASLTPDFTWPTIAGMVTGSNKTTLPWQLQNSIMRGKSGKMATRPNSLKPAVHNPAHWIQWPFTSWNLKLGKFAALFYIFLSHYIHDTLLHQTKATQIF